MGTIKTVTYILLFLTISSCKNNSELKDVTTSVTDIENSNELIDDSKNFTLLQGSWQNTLDSLSVIKIKGNVITNFYSNISAGPGVKIELSDHCVSKPDPSRAIEKDRYISITGTYTDCYYISKLDAQNLSLNFLNGGFDLTFKKIN